MTEKEEYELYKIPHNAPRYSVEDMRNDETRHQILESLQPDEWFVAVGYDCFSIGSQVKIEVNFRSSLPKRSGVGTSFLPGVC